MSAWGCPHRWQLQFTHLFSSRFIFFTHSLSWSALQVSPTIIYLDRNFFSLRNSTLKSWAAETLCYLVELGAKNCWHHGSPLRTQFRERLIVAVSVLFLFLLLTCQVVRHVDWSLKQAQLLVKALWPPISEIHTRSDVVGNFRRHSPAL